MTTTRTGRPRFPTSWPALALAATLAIAAPAWGQAPQVDVDGPPGVADHPVSRLGRPLGSAGMQTSQESSQPIGGRAGPSVSRAPIAALSPPSMRTAMEPARFLVPTRAPMQGASYGELDLPADAMKAEIGPADGLTLDQSIDLLMRANLDLLALKYEIPMADADVLTASLRANPIVYADAQLVPYGRYSNARPGGQTQYDVNITVPLDVTGKRRSRTDAAIRARRVTEAQFQDAVRMQVDNLYTVYVDVVSASETLRFSEAFLTGIGRLLEIRRSQLTAGEIVPAEVDELAARLEQAQLQVRESREALITAKRALALMLDIPRQQADSIEVRALIRDFREVGRSDDELIRLGLENRPDVIAHRLGVERAGAEIKLARANRYSDVYLLVQPFTFQDNRPTGFKSAYSYAVGVTANLPVSNRNQGNIKRAQLNQTQTLIERQAIERQVEQQVDAAAREFRLSRTSVLEIEREILPAYRRVHDTALRRWQGGETPLQDYLEAQGEYNKVVREYRDTLVRHRRSMLSLNTAVGVRVLP
ncbi:TolC family protein [Isosphaeraceae bacterium EP7]